MRIVILGAGKTGAYVATVLSEERHSVVLIDRDRQILEQVGRESDVATLFGQGPSWMLLAEQIESKPDLFFAATGDNETNLVACSIAKNLGFPKTVARIKGTDYLNHTKLDFRRLFCVDHFIGAEVLVATDLFNTIVHAGDLAVEHFAHGTIQMRSLKIPDRWDKGGISLKDLSLPTDFIVGLIRRKTAEGEAILIPRGDDHILPGDEVTIVGKAHNMHRISEVFKTAENKIRSVILFGGSSIAEHLAFLLGEQKISVRIIEKEETKCHELANKLPHATILNRDGKDLHFLHSEGVETSDAFVSCTENDEENFLVAALAGQLNCPKPIALLNDATYTQIFEKVGVVPASSSRVKIANRILSILHEESILSVGSLCCDAAKIIELKVAPSSPLIGIPLADLGSRLPKDFLIAMIENRGNISIGSGIQTLSPHDTVIAICHPQRIPEIPPLFHT